MHFSLPRSQIYLTAIPKTGCTSAMNFFVGIESWLENRKLNLSQVNFNERIEIEYEDSLGSAIHSRESKSQIYLVDSDYSPKNQTTIATFRNPYDRFTSFWFDKVVLLRDQSYIDFGLLNFANFEDLNLDIIRSSAKFFLTQNIDISSNLDPHVKPQIFFYKPGIKYDLFVETEDLNTIPGELVRHSTRYRMLEDLDFPEFNDSLPSHPEDFYDEELSFLLRKFYALDFDFIRDQTGNDFQSVSKNERQFENSDLLQIEKSRRQNAIKALRTQSDNLRTQSDNLRTQSDNLRTQSDNLRTERDNLRIERDNLRIERDNLRIEREVIFNSRSWRYTAPLRKLWERQKPI
jgi:hypothetical protein